MYTQVLRYNRICDVTIVTCLMPSSATKTPLCIVVPPAQSGVNAQREVTLTLKHGVEAKSWEDVSYRDF